MLSLNSRWSLVAAPLPATIIRGDRRGRATSGDLSPVAPRDTVTAMARPEAPARALAALSAALLLGAAEPARDYPVKPVPFTAVHFTDALLAAADRGEPRR